MSRPQERDPHDWEQHYVSGQLPWETERPDMHLPQIVDAFGIAPGKAIEIGCGTGNNAIWLDRQGFDVLSLDVSPTAIEMARAKVKQAGAGCELRVANFLTEDIAEGPFDFAYDRGCFHTFMEPNRSLFAKRLADLLASGGIWHSLIGSTDGPPRDSGPPRRSAVEIATAVEPHFEILSLAAAPFDEDEHVQKMAWKLVARRR